MNHEMLDYQELGNGIYIVRESPERSHSINSILLDQNDGEDAVLIDANYPFNLMDELYGRIKSPALAAIFSHTHPDHIAHAYYHEKKYKTPILCPIQEEEYLLSFDALSTNFGFEELGLGKQYRMMIKHFMKFEECKKVESFNPGQEILDYEKFEIETIHIPGHSPGQTAFKIHSKEEDKNKDILFVSDIGSHPYYGDLNSNLKEYRVSIDRLEHVYLTSDYFLIPAHGIVYKERNEEFFEKIRQKINKNGERVLNHLSKKIPKNITQLVYEGSITPKNRQDSRVYDLYLRWDGGMIFQHLLELVKQDLVENLDNKDFLTDRYILK